MVRWRLKPFFHFSALPNEQNCNREKSFQTFANCGFRRGSRWYFPAIWQLLFVRAFAFLAFFLLSSAEMPIWCIKCVNHTFVMKWHTVSVKPNFCIIQIFSYFGPHTKKILQSLGDTYTTFYYSQMVSIFLYFLWLLLTSAIYNLLAILYKTYFISLHYSKGPSFFAFVVGFRQYFYQLNYWLRNKKGIKLFV